MNVKQIEAALNEAYRFVKTAEAAIQAETKHEFYDGAEWHPYVPTMHTGAVRRASMDLTRSLANLRKPEHEVKP